MLPSHSRCRVNPGIIPNLFKQTPHFAIVTDFTMENRCAKGLAAVVAELAMLVSAIQKKSYSDKCFSNVPVWFEARGAGEDTKMEEEEMKGVEAEEEEEKRGGGCGMLIVSFIFSGKSGNIQVDLEIVLGESEEVIGLMGAAESSAVVSNMSIILNLPASFCTIFTLKVPACSTLGRLVSTSLNSSKINFQLGRSLGSEAVQLIARLMNLSGQPGSALERIESGSKPRPGTTLTK